MSFARGGHPRACWLYDGIAVMLTGQTPLTRQTLSTRQTFGVFSEDPTAYASPSVSKIAASKASLAPFPAQTTNWKAW